MGGSTDVWESRTFIPYSIYIPSTVNGQIARPPFTITLPPPLLLLLSNVLSCSSALRTQFLRHTDSSPLTHPANQGFHSRCRPSHTDSVVNRSASPNAILVRARCVPATGPGWVLQSRNSRCSNFCMPYCRVGTHSAVGSLDECRSLCIANLSTGCTMFSYGLTPTADIWTSTPTPGGCLWNDRSIASSGDANNINESCHEEYWVGWATFRVMTTNAPTNAPTSGPTRVPSIAPSGATLRPTSVPATSIAPSTAHVEGSPSIAPSTTALPGPLTLQPTGVRGQGAAGDGSSSGSPDSYLGIIIAGVLGAVVCTAIGLVCYRRRSNATANANHTPHPTMNPAFAPEFASERESTSYEAAVAHNPVYIASESGSGVVAVSTVSQGTYEMPVAHNPTYRATRPPHRPHAPASIYSAVPPTNAAGGGRKQLLDSDRYVASTTRGTTA
eukprot:m.295256 g.295256  ORF g.295256 m.295256 type:complete len:443 (-) comp27174_c2_seq11:111-1439(-)